MFLDPYSAGYSGLPPLLGTYTHLDNMAHYAGQQARQRRQQESQADESRSKANQTQSGSARRKSGSEGLGGIPAVTSSSTATQRYTPHTVSLDAPTSWAASPSHNNFPEVAESTSRGSSIGVVAVCVAALIGFVFFLGRSEKSAAPSAVGISQPPKHQDSPIEKPQEQDRTGEAPSDSDSGNATNDDLPPSSPPSPAGDAPASGAVGTAATTATVLVQGVHHLGRNHCTGELVFTETVFRFTCPSDSFIVERNMIDRVDNNGVRLLGRRGKKYHFNIVGYDKDSVGALFSRWLER